MKEIDVGKMFSIYPAGRYETDGPFSGERFRKELLVPALRTKERVRILLDGTRGYGSSFLEEVFGGAVRAGELTYTDFVDRLELVYRRDPTLIDEIAAYVRDAIAEREASAGNR